MGKGLAREDARMPPRRNVRLTERAMSNEQNKKWDQEPWSVYESDQIKSSDGSFVLEDLGYDGLYVNNWPNNIPRIVACVNFLSSHPDLSAVEVIDKAELESLRAKDMRFSRRESSDLRAQLDQCEALYNALLKSVAAGSALQTPQPIALHGASAQEALNTVIAYELRSQRDELLHALKNFYAMVEGECPSLLEDDINADLAWAAIEKASK